MRNEQSDDEVAAEFDQLFAEGKEMEGLERVKARVSKDPRAVFSVRLRSGELSEITRAAEAHALTVSEFMRQASLSAARGYVDLRAGEQRAALLMIRETAEQLYQAVEKLEQAPGEEKTS